jgi:hypothetical protein
VWSAQRIPPAINLCFLHRTRYFFIQVAPQLSSRGWVDHVPDAIPWNKKNNSNGAGCVRLRSAWESSAVTNTFEMFTSVWPHALIPVRCICHVILTSVYGRQRENLSRGLDLETMWNEATKVPIHEHSVESEEIRKKLGYNRQMFSLWYSYFSDQCFSALFRGSSSQLYCYGNLIRWIKMYVNQVSQFLGRCPYKIRNMNAIKTQIKKVQANKWRRPCAECRSKSVTP